jgi:predicted N-acetyltransferase YhbS
MLIAEGLNELREMGVDLVFVLGYPGYYQKHGFSPAGVKGYAAPYPIPPEHADAWMVQELRPGIMEQTRGRVRCAETLTDPKHWRE